MFVEVDTPISFELVEEWQKMFETNSFDSVIVKRWYGNVVDKVYRIEIHGLSNSSLEAYVCWIYLHIIHLDGSTKASLVTYKSRVALIKDQTIPKLELIAAVLLR